MNLAILYGNPRQQRYLLIPESVPVVLFSAGLILFKATLTGGSTVEVVNGQLYVDDLFIRQVTDIEARALQLDLTQGN